jgi:hypothetical protein
MRIEFPLLWRWSSYPREREIPVENVACRTDNNWSDREYSLHERGNGLLSMDDVVEQVLQTYQLIGKIEPDRIETSREKITDYIEKLNAARRFNAHQLTMYGIAYLKKLHEGPDPRFTGC